MHTPKFYCKRNSQIPFGLEFERGEIYQAYLKQFREGTRLEVTVKKYVPKRSDRQNAFYWGVVIKEICAETGQPQAQAHAGLKQMFLKVHHEKLPTVRSTTDLTTAEFKIYIDQCVLWAAEWLHIAIPEPYAVEY